MDSLTNKVIDDISFTNKHYLPHNSDSLVIKAGQYKLILNADDGAIAPDGEDYPFIRSYLYVFRGRDTIFESITTVTLDTLMYWMQYVKYHSQLEE